MQEMFSNIFDVYLKPVVVVMVVMVVKKELMEVLYDVFPMIDDDWRIYEILINVWIKFHRLNYVGLYHFEIEYVELVEELHDEFRY